MLTLSLTFATYKQSITGQVALEQLHVFYQLTPHTRLLRQCNKDRLSYGQSNAEDKQTDQDSWAPLLL